MGERLHVWTAHLFTKTEKKIITISGSISLEVNDIYPICKAILDNNDTYLGITYCTSGTTQEPGHRNYIIRENNICKRYNSKTSTREEIAKFYINYPVFDLWI